MAAIHCKHSLRSSWSGQRRGSLWHAGSPSSCRVRCRAASNETASTNGASTAGVQPLTGRAKVSGFLKSWPQGQSIMMDMSETQKRQLSAFIEQMIAENPTPAPGAAAIADGLGAGTWKVFWAPHISAMSSAMFTRFEPILYRFEADGTIASHVKYSVGALGTGWLSASGTMSKETDNSVTVAFDKFWVDVGENSLRQTLEDEEAAMTSFMGVQLKMDAIVGAAGRAMFFPPLSIFPVVYLDPELAVFEFPPLRSKIAITRLPDVVA